MIIAKWLCLKEGQRSPFLGAIHTEMLQTKLSNDQDWSPNNPVWEEGV